MPHELTDELGWDFEALSAAEALTNDRLTASGAATNVQGRYPSLILNLADVYRRLGDRTQAQHHLDRGHPCVALPHDEYGAMIRETLDRVEQRLVDPSAPRKGRSTRRRVKARPAGHGRALAPEAMTRRWSD